jgi:VCBS repeat-containing protein
MAHDGPGNSAAVTVALTVRPVNDVPVGAADTATTDEDAPVAIQVLANDSDADNDTLAVGGIEDPAHGSAVANGDGGITYTPAANYFGLDSFTYTVTDGQGASHTAGVAIIVNAVNDQPVAAADAASTTEDVSVAIDVLDNDLDVDGDPLGVMAVGTPAHGTAVLSPDGGITYTPASNHNGTDTFTYTIMDGHGGLATAGVSIEITGLDDEPEASDDSYSTSEDTALDVAAPGVLGNDNDADGDSMIAIQLSSPSHGTLTLNSDGTFSYRPMVNFSGSDSFTYKVSDGGLDSETATVTIVVNPVNDSPLGISDSYGVNEDTLLTTNAPGVLGNDTDTEEGALIATLVEGPASGALTFNEDGSFTYRPENNFNGTVSFTYSAGDGLAASAPATVTILVSAVNDTPTAVEDHYGMNEDGTLAIAASGLLANDLDNDSTSLTALLVGRPSNGNVTLSLDGSFSYSPNANYNGGDSFTYKVNDGALESAPVTVNITINAINDAPAAGADSFVSSEDTSMVVLAPGVLLNDSDAENDALTLTVVSGTSHGILTFGSDGGFTYLPDTDYHGSDSFTYTLNDGHVDSAAATVTLTVGGVNDAAVANDDHFTAEEDTVLTVAGLGFGVLTNDTDLDANPLTAIQVSAAGHGTVLLNADGGFRYTPNANFNGTDSFTYRVFDGTIDSNIATVTIAVTAVDDGPAAGNNSYATNEGEMLLVAAPGVLANDADGEGDTLTAVLVNGASHGVVMLNGDGSFSYTPEEAFNGLDSFTYQATDGSEASNVATVTITVNPINDAPGASNDSYAAVEDTALTIGGPAGVLANDNDADSGGLTASIVTSTHHGTVTLNADGSFTYMPAANYNGEDSFTYTANDGTADSNVATVTLMIAAVNDAPVANNNSYTKNEDVTLTVSAPGVLGNDPDVEGNPKTAILVSGPSHGVLTLNGNGSFTFVPEANYNGPDSFTYKANDGALDSNVATVAIKVTAVNDSPVGVSDSYSATEDTPLTVGAPGLLANDSDIEGSALTAIRATTPQHGTVTLSASGGFVYTPAANYNGADAFYYRANDGTASSPWTIVRVTVGAVNDAPAANNQTRTLNEDATRSVTLTGSDVDRNTLTFTVLSYPTHGMLTGTAPSLSYVPKANYYGPDSFTFQVTDGLLNSNTGTVSLIVASVNDTPKAQAASYTTPLNTPRSGYLVATDVDDNRLSYFISTQPTKGTVTVNAGTGAFTYTPFAGRTGSDYFRFKASDGTATSSSARIDLRILP